MAMKDEMHSSGFIVMAMKDKNEVVCAGAKWDGDEGRNEFAKLCCDERASDIFCVAGDQQPLSFERECY